MARPSPDPTCLKGPTMTQFINTRETVVTEAIDGLLRASGGRLGRLDGYLHIKLVAYRLGPQQLGTRVRWRMGA